MDRIKWNTNFCFFVTNMGLLLKETSESTKEKEMCRSQSQLFLSLAGYVLFRFRVLARCGIEDKLPR